MRMCSLLGYATGTKGYQLLGVKAGAVVTARAGNIRFHEEFTVESGCIDKLLQNTIFRADHEMTSHVFVVRMKAGMHPYMPEADKRRPPIAIAEDGSDARAHSDVAGMPPESTYSAQPNRKRSARDDISLICKAFEELDWTPLPSSRAAPVNPRALAKRQRKLSVRMWDYVANSGRVDEDVVVPTTYKQVQASPQ